MGALEAKKAKSAFVPTCKPDGNFQALQCVGRFCWCAGSKGQTIPRTFHLKEKMHPIAPTIKLSRSIARARENPCSLTQLTARDRDQNKVNARKKKHGKDTQHQRRKKEEQNHFRQHKLVFSRASERQSQFILWHKNYNDHKKDTIFCGHKKTHIEKKRYWQLVYKGGKKGVVEYQLEFGLKKRQIFCHCFFFYSFEYFLFMFIYFSHLGN